MQGTEIARSSARGGAILASSSLFSFAALAVTTIVIARVLGPSDYGLYTLSIFFPELLYVLSGYGINVGITRSSARYLSNGDYASARRVTLNGTLFVSAVGAFLSLASYFASGLVSGLIFHRPDLVPYMHFASLVTFSESLLHSAIFALIGWDSVGKAALLSSAQSALKSSMSLALVLSGFGVFGALYGHVLSYLFTGVLAMVTLYASRLSPFARPVGSMLGDIKDLTLYGFPLSTSSLASTAAGSYIVALVASAGGSVAVGLYEGAANITAVITQGSTAIATALLPAFARLQSSEGDTRLALQYAVKYASYVLTPIVVFVTGFSGLIIGTVYGSSYADAGVYLAILSAAFLPIFLGLTVFPTYFNGLGRTRLTMSSHFLGALAIVLSAPTLGAAFGVYGVVSSVVISGIIISVSSVFLSSKYLLSKLDFGPLLKIPIACLPSYLVVFLVNHAGPVGPVELVLDAFIFLSVYLVVLPIIRAIDYPDIESLQSAAKSLGMLKNVVNTVLGFETFVLHRSSRRREYSNAGSGGESP